MPSGEDDDIVKRDTFGPEAGSIRVRVGRAGPGGSPLGRAGVGIFQVKYTNLCRCGLGLSGSVAVPERVRANQPGAWESMLPSRWERDGGPWRMLRAAFGALRVGSSARRAFGGCLGSKRR